MFGIIYADNQLQRPLYATAYYLNSHFHFEPNFRVDDSKVKEELYMCVRKLIKDVVERKKINLQLVDMLEGFFQWMMQKYAGKNYLLENGGRYLRILQS